MVEAKEESEFVPLQGQEIVSFLQRPDQLWDTPSLDLEGCCPNRTYMAPVT
jgi:hypothetical protein